MKSIGLTFAALLCGTLLTGSALAAAEESFLVVDGADAVETFKLSPTVNQINYALSVPYPGQAVGDPQWQQMEAAGWHRCRTAVDDWTQSADTSVTPNRAIHERQAAWTKDDQMIVIKLRYYSTVDGPTPDNQTQRVHLVFYSERAQAMASYLKVDCGQ